MALDPRYAARGAAMLVRQELAGERNISLRRTQAFAFLSIMHPEVALDERLQMAAEIAEADRASDTGLGER